MFGFCDYVFEEQLFGCYTSRDEYQNLLPLEKEKMDFLNRCLFDENPKIRVASSKMEQLIIEMYSRYKLDDEMTFEEVTARRNEIMKDLSDFEKKIVESFEGTCIDCIGIYSKQSTIKRRLKKGMINNGKDK